MKSTDIVKIENLSNTKEVFTIRWQLTYLCNYNCDFCIQGNKNQHVNKSKGETIEIREKICNNIVNLIEKKLNKKYKMVIIYLIGGEITILKDFLEILKKLLDCKFEGQINIHITTNLSTNKETLEKIVELLKKDYEYARYLTISASYYKKFTTEEEFMEKIGIICKKEKTLRRILRTSKLYKKIKKYKDKKIKVKSKTKNGKIFVNVNYPICEDKEYKDYKKFKRKYIGRARTINYIVIKDYNKSISDKLKNKLRKKTQEKELLKVVTNNNKIYYLSNMNKISLQLEDENSFNPKGYLCDIGINSINISNLGIVSRCLASPIETKIGDMKENEILNLPTEKLICTLNKCNCSYYGVIEKNI